MTLIEELKNKLDEVGIGYEIGEAYEGTVLYVDLLELSALEFDEPDEEEEGCLEVISNAHCADLLTVDELYDYIVSNY